MKNTVVVLTVVLPCPSKYYKYWIDKKWQHRKLQGVVPKTNVHGYSLRESKETGQVARFFGDQ